MTTRTRVEELRLRHQQIQDQIRNLFYAQKHTKLGSAKSRKQNREERDLLEEDKRIVIELEKERANG